MRELYNDLVECESIGVGHHDHGVDWVVCFVFVRLVHDHVSVARLDFNLETGR